ncbi:MAG: helix-turn-helix transcriptional regulator [Candidatus Dormibacteria bacterium]
MEADQLAARVGLHRNTVRAHLEVLREVGLVRAHALPSAGPGRPRLAFSGIPSLLDDGQSGAYRLLARVLATALEEHPDGRQRAVAAGRIVGRELANESAPEEVGSRRAALVGLLDRLGFAPRTTGETAGRSAEVIQLQQCPFHELAGNRSAIVCTVHRGLLEGACEQLGESAGSVRLLPFVEPGRCAVHLDRS